MFVEQMESKLDGLAQSYLRLLNAAFHHREYLNTTNPESIRHEARELEKGLTQQAPKVQEINRKRIEILNKRVEKYEKVREICQVIDAQCAAVDEVLQLIRDRSVKVTGSVRMPSEPHQSSCDISVDSRYHHAKSLIPFGNIYSRSTPEGDGRSVHRNPRIGN